MNIKSYRVFRVHMSQKERVRKDILVNTYYNTCTLQGPFIEDCSKLKLIIYSVP